MNFSEEQVQAGRALVNADSDAKLELGDLIGSVVSVSAHGTNQHTRDLMVLEGEDPTAVGSTEDRVKAYAEAIGIGADQAEVYRQVSAKIPQELRDVAKVHGVTVTYGVWRHAAYGDTPERQKKLREMILENKGGRVKKDDFLAATKNTKGEPYAPSHRQSQSVAGQLADPVARKILIETIAADKDATKQIIDQSIKNKPTHVPTSPATPNLKKYMQDKVKTASSCIDALFAKELVDVISQFTDTEKQMLNWELRQTAQAATNLAEIFKPTNLDEELKGL